MSSPFRRSDQARSSPSRQRINGYHHPHRGSLDDASSTQFLEELSQLMIDDDRAFKNHLEEQSKQQQKLQVEALEKALAQHEAVRTSAQQMYDRIQLELSAERKRREDEERRKLDEARQRAEDEERKRQEEQQRREAEEQRRQEAAQKRQQEEAARKQREVEAKAKQEAERQKAEADKARTEQEQVQRAAQQQQAQQQQQQQQPQRQQQEAARAQASSSQSNGTTSAATPSAAQPHTNLPAGVQTSQEERQAEHASYKRIHENIQQLKKMFEDNGLAKKAGDVRRDIGKTVGQLKSTDREFNKDKTKIVMTALRQCRDAAPEINDVAQFFHPPRSEPTQGSLMLIWLLSAFSEFVIDSMMAELVGKNPVERGNAAEPYGIIVAQIFSLPDFNVANRSLMDIFWANYRPKCPFLFGLLPYTTSDEVVVKNNEVGAIASGFAAVTLRDFHLTQGKTNPAPNRLFWEAFARILNIPVAQRQGCHYDTLVSFLSPKCVERFIGFYGQAARVAIKQAIQDYPQPILSGPPGHKYYGRAGALRGIRFTLENELYLSL